LEASPWQAELNLTNHGHVHHTKLHKRIIKPPLDREDLSPTRLCKNAFWKLIVPFIFHHGNLACGIGVDIDDAIDDLLFSNAFDLVSVAKVHGYWIAGGGHGEGEALDFGKCGLQAVPLRLVLFTALGFGERVGEYCVILVGGLVECQM
jgi:hypothetical protein